VVGLESFDKGVDRLWGEVSRARARVNECAQANSIIMSFLFDEILLTVILTVSKDNPDQGSSKNRLQSRTDTV
jgi:hypothetical protein